MPFSRATLRPWLRHLCLGAAVLPLLVACGGGTEGDAPGQTKPEVISLSGTAYLGQAGYTPDVLVQVKAAAGTARTVPFTGPQAYSAKVGDLTAPYAAALALSNDSTGEGSRLVAIATTPGIANVTPLTTLVVAQALGQDPSTYFDSLAIPGDATLGTITAAQLAVGQDRTVRYLSQTLGLALPAGLGDFTTTPFTPVAGDPMFDTVTAFNAALAARGTDLASVARALAAEAVRCNAEALQIQAGSTRIDFCPETKTTEPDAEADTVRYSFGTHAGAQLTLTAQGSQVLSVRQVNEAGQAFACQGTACTGVTLGSEGEDGSRSIGWNGTALTGPTGRLTLTGQLQSAARSVGLPPLPCDTNFYYLIQPDAVQGSCAQSDDVGYGAGQTRSAGDIRRIYTFQSDGSVEPPPPMLEVRADGEQVASVVVFDFEADTGLPRVLNKCTGADCSGVTVGPATDDSTSFAPYVIRTRPITLADTALPALAADGTPSSEAPVTVRAEFTSVEIILPGPFSAAPCASAATRVVATFGGADAALSLCPPADTAGFDDSAFLRTDLDGDGEPQFLITSLYSDGLGSAFPAGGVTVTLQGGAVRSVTLTLFDGTVYGCEGTACTGVSVGGPDGTGAHTLTLTGTLLTEHELADLPGTRQATLNGAFTAPPPP